jgi:hypothetical protein
MRKSRRTDLIRRRLPYGVWRCPDGREVLFDRDYHAICERRPGQSVSLALTDRVCCATQSWLYNDGTPPPEKVRRSEAKLAEWGVLDLVMAKIEQEVSRDAEAAERRCDRITDPSSRRSPC